MFQSLTTLLNPVVWANSPRAAVIAITRCCAFGATLLVNLFILRLLLRAYLLRKLDPLRTIVAVWRSRGYMSKFGVPCAEMPVIDQIRTVITYGTAHATSNTSLLSWFSGLSKRDAALAVAYSTRITYNKSIVNDIHTTRVRYSKAKEEKAKKSKFSAHPVSRTTRDTAVGLIRSLPRKYLSYSSCKYMCGTNYNFRIPDARISVDIPDPSETVIAFIDDFDLCELNVIGDILLSGAVVANYTINPYYDSCPESSLIYNPDGNFTINVTSAPGVSATYTHRLVYHAHDEFYIRSTEGHIVRAKILAKRIQYNSFVYFYVPIVAYPSCLEEYVSSLGVNPLGFFPPTSAEAIALTTVDTVRLTLVGSDEWYTMDRQEYNQAVAASRSPQFNVASLATLRKRTDVREYSLLHILKAVASSKKIQYLGVRTDTNYQSTEFEVTEVEPNPEIIPGPLNSGAVSSVYTDGSDANAVKHRVIELYGDSVGVFSRVGTFFDEFAHEISRRVGPLAPLPEEGVIESITAPNKKKQAEGIFNNTNVGISTNNVAFTKVEVTDTTKDNRNISAVDPRHTTRYAMYIKPLTDSIKSIFPWFCVGYSPVEMDNKVQCLLHDPSGKLLVESDASRFDGSQTAVMSSLLVIILGNVFANHREAQELATSLDNSVFRTKGGSYYNTQFTRKSGSRDTTLGNTLVNAAVHYYYYRKYEGLGIEDALDALGIYHGDDGVTLVNSVANLEAAWSDCGFKVKVIAHEDRATVTFLGRVFDSSGGSFLDPVRFLQKLTVVPSGKQYSPHVKLANKLAGIAIIDSKGITGHIALILFNKLIVEKKLSYVMATYAHDDIRRLTTEEVLVAENPWPEPISLDISKEYFMRATNIEPDVLKNYLNEILVKPIDKCPTMVTSEPPSGNYLFGDVVIGDTPLQPVPKVSKAEARSKADCYKQYAPPIKNEKGRFVLACSDPLHDHKTVCISFLRSECKKKNCPRYHPRPEELKLANPSRSLVG